MKKTVVLAFAFAASLGMQVSAGITVGARVFTDRQYAFAELPEGFRALEPISVSLDGQKRIPVTKDGWVTVLTPDKSDNPKDNCVDALARQGFRREESFGRLSPFEPFHPCNSTEVWLREMKRGETLEFGPWGIPFYGRPVAAKGPETPADLGAKTISRTCTVTGRDTFHGYDRVKFKFLGRDAWVVFPKSETAIGRPWTWTMQWSEAFVERTGVPYALQRGFHHASLEAFDTRANDAALPLFAAFQRFLVGALGLAPQVNLVGLSWGGFFSTRYAAAYPENVNAIFLDAPLITFQDFHEDIGPWTREPPKGEWRDDPRMPVNLAAKIARARIPVLIAYGGKDTSCPAKDHAEAFVRAFRSADGRMNVCPFPDRAHHPHGFDAADVHRVYDFFHNACRRVEPADYPVKPIVGFNLDFWYYFETLGVFGVETDPKWKRAGDMPKAWYRRFEPTKKGLEDYVDLLARDGKITHFVVNVNAQRTGFDSKVMEPIWKDGCRTNGAHAQWNFAKTLKKFHDEGIDPYAVWVDRCREKGLKSVLSFRMNDAHGAQTADHCPSISDFWRNNPQYRLGGGLNWSRKAVRDRMFAFVRECLERYDCDGIELDWTRFSDIFPAGEVAKCAPLLTDDMRALRVFVDDLQRRRGRKVMIVCRFTSCPETEFACGRQLDVWARERLMDAVDAGGHFWSADYRIPVADWKALLGPDIIFVPHIDNGLAIASGAFGRRHLEREEYLGFADLVFAQGCAGINLFNLFSQLPDSREWTEALRDGFGRDVLLKGAREYPLSHRDFHKGFEKEQYAAKLPFGPGGDFRCQIPVGSVPTGFQAKVILGYEAMPSGEPEVWLNGVRSIGGAERTERVFDSFAADNTKRVPCLVFRLPEETAQAGENDVRVSNVGGRLVYAALRIEPSRK